MKKGATSNSAQTWVIARCDVCTSLLHAEHKARENLIKQPTNTTVRYLVFSHTVSAYCAKTYKRMLRHRAFCWATALGSDYYASRSVR